MALISRCCAMTNQPEIQVMAGSIPLSGDCGERNGIAETDTGELLFFSGLAPRASLLVFLLVSAAIDG
jgi:hypothetical protein